MWRELVIAAAASALLGCESPGDLELVGARAVVVRGAQRQLRFLGQPQSAVAGVKLSPPVQVAVTDGDGNPVEARYQLSLRLVANPGGSWLFGTPTLDTSAGVATFDDLALNRVGTGYTLEATTPGLLTATSDAFDVAPGPVSATRSAVTASPLANVTADGVAVAVVTVALVDEFDNAVPGKNASLSATGLGAIVGQPLASSGADGKATGTLASSRARTQRVRATAGGVDIIQEAKVRFVFTPPEVVALSVSGTGGCVLVSYAVRQAQSQRVDVAVEFDETGSGIFRRATQAASTTHDGVNGITTVPAVTGQPHDFLWNSTFDIPARSVSAARVRVTASLSGAAGVPMTAMAPVSNGASFVSAPPAAGIEVSDFASADFNLDGTPDLAGPQRNADAVAVLLGAGDGRFAVSSTPAVAQLPLSIATGDFNRDGKPDLATGNGMKSVSVLLGRGDGTFDPAATYDQPTEPLSIIAADLNGDGKLDIATTDWGARINVRLGNGDGTFQPPTNQTDVNGAVLSAARVLVTSDFNRDGKADLATAGPSGSTVTVLVGNGDGSFKAPIVLSAGMVARTLAVGDFDRDGCPDLAVAGTNATGTIGQVTVWFGDGAGGFPRSLANTAGIDLTVLVSADFDGDGVADLVAGGPSQLAFFLLGGVGDGSFRPPMQFQPSSPTFLWPAIAVDFNKDGKADLGYSAGSLGTGAYLNAQPARCDPGFDSGARTAMAGARAIAAADFDGDGKPDIAAGGWAGLEVMAGVGNGGFSAPRHSLGGVQLDALATGDFDSDGLADLAAAGIGTGTIHVMRSNGNGTLDAPDDYSARGVEGLAVADLDDDGVPDLVTAGSVLLGKGDGTFLPALAFGGPVSGRGVAIGDFDGDGNLDLASTNSTSTVSMHLGNADGTFRTTTTLPVGDDPHGITAADLNGDGALDLVTANFGGNSVSVLIGRGDGSFSARTDVAVKWRPSRVMARDLDGDGKVDVVIGQSYYCLSVLPGLGDGRFGPRLDYPAGRSLDGLGMADFDGDARLDLATISGGYGWAYFGFALLGREGGAFNSPIELPTAGQPFRVASGDFNRDGIPDLVASGFGGNAVSVVLGKRSGGFEPGIDYALGAVGDIVPVDVNRDGRLDLALSTQGALKVALGKGDGAFAPAVVIPAAVAWEARIVAGDFNRDGAIDLATSGGGATGTALFLGNGDGTFQPPGYLSPSGAIVAGDFDRDGKLDLAITGGPNQVILLGNGDGTFRSTSAPFGWTGDLATGDFDGNGILDLAASQPTSGSIGIQAGDGTGAFAAAAYYPAGDYPLRIASADFNGNGTLDLLSVNTDSHDVGLFQGVGDGTLRPLASFFVGDSPYAAIAVDLNRDGKLDVVAACRWELGLRVLYGR